ncbi:MAG: hypothetical protein ACOVP5_01655 [Chitinophagales bacterium]
MNFGEILTVSKLPGLYQMHKKRADGLILKAIGDDKVFFASSRAHGFTPLENITIYTDTEPMELVKVFQNIDKYKAKSAIPSAKDSSDKLKTFFESVVPNYDVERVYVSDIQKIIKWHSLLSANSLIPSEDQKEAKDSKLEKIEKSEKTDKTKKSDKATKETSSESPAPKAKKTTKKIKE